MAKRNPETAGSVRVVLQMINGEIVLAPAEGPADARPVVLTPDDLPVVFAPLGWTKSSVKDIVSWLKQGLVFDQIFMPPEAASTLFLPRASVEVGPVTPFAPEKLEAPEPEEIADESALIEEAKDALLNVVLAQPDLEAALVAGKLRDAVDFSPGIATAALFSLASEGLIDLLSPAPMEELSPAVAAEYVYAGQGVSYHLVKLHSDEEPAAEPEPEEGPIVMPEPAPMPIGVLPQIESALAKVRKGLSPKAVVDLQNELDDLGFLDVSVFRNVTKADWARVIDAPFAATQEGDDWAKITSFERFVTLLRGDAPDTEANVERAWADFAGVYALTQAGQFKYALPRTVVLPAYMPEEPESEPVVLPPSAPRELVPAPEYVEESAVELLAALRDVSKEMLTEQDWSGKQPLVSTTALRKLTPLGKARFDEAALYLMAQGDVSMLRHDYPFGMTAVERQGLVFDGKSTYYNAISLTAPVATPEPVPVSPPPPTDQLGADMEDVLGTLKEMNSHYGHMPSDSADVRGLFDSTYLSSQTSSKEGLARFAVAVRQLVAEYKLVLSDLRKSWPSDPRDAVSIDEGATYYESAALSPEEVRALGPDWLDPKVVAERLVENEYLRNLEHNELVAVCHGELPQRAGTETLDHYLGVELIVHLDVVKERSADIAAELKAEARSLLEDRISEDRGHRGKYGGKDEGTVAVVVRGPDPRQLTFDAEDMPSPQALAGAWQAWVREKSMAGGLKGGPELLAYLPGGYAPVAPKAQAAENAVLNSLRKNGWIDGAISVILCERYWDDILERLPRFAGMTLEVHGDAQDFVDEYVAEHREEFRDERELQLYLDAVLEHGTLIVSLGDELVTVDDWLHLMLRE
jgi:hypothetical protein